jgi:hypothetical protein
LGPRCNSWAYTAIRRPRRAAANHARLWSLVASAERHGVCPQRYLTSVLAKLPLVAPDTEALVPFLPDVWQRDDAAEPPTD